MNGLAALSVALLAALARGQGAQAEGEAELAELAAFEGAIRRGSAGRDLREDLDDYLAEFPGSVRALSLRVDLRRRTGAYEDALADVSRIRALPPGDLATRVLAARAAFDLHLELGSIAECALDLDRGLGDGDPAERAFAPIHARRIVLLATTGRREEAYSVFARNFKDSMRDSEPAEIVLELGRSLLAMGEVERAARVLVVVEKAWRDAADPRQAEALVLLGRAYRIGHSQGDLIPAIETLDDALAVDARNVPARVERALASIFRLDLDKARETIEEALGLNPRSPDARAVRAEIHLYEQRASDALAAAEQALAENPRHGLALAARAASLGILGRREEAQAAFSRLLQAEPDRAENFCRHADVLAYLYRFREAIPVYRRAIQIDPKWSQSYVGMARCLVNTGDLEGALAALHEFRRIDRVPHMLADNVGNALSALAGFVEVERGTFTYLVHPVESPVLVPLLDDLYARVWPDLCARYGFDVERRVRVECFPEHDDFSARTVGFTGFGALGVCFGDVFTLLSPRSELRGQFSFDKTAVHELVHVVTLGLSKNKVPRWLTEGISVHEEHVYASNADREMDLDLFNFFHSGEIVPVRELNRLFGGPRILFGYYQGGLLCDFLVEQRGETVLREMLERFAADAETADVVQAVLGMSCEQLDHAFLEWLERTRIAGMRVQPTYTDGGRRRLLERVRAARPPDAALLAQVAWAYHAAGREVDRDDFLNQALKADPDLPAARFLLAERALERRKLAEARREFEAGLAAGGEEFFALLRYAGLLATEAGVRAGGPDAEAAEALDEPARRARERILDLLARAKACFPRYVAENTPYLLRARLLRELGRDEEALAELRDFCDIHESETTSRTRLVQAALERGDSAEARRYLLELRGLDPFQRAIWRDLARCERELGRPADAITLLERALAIDPSTEPDYDPARAELPVDETEARVRAELLLDLAELRFDVGERDAALRALEEARALAPDAGRIEALDERAAGTGVRD